MGGITPLDMKAYSIVRAIKTNMVSVEGQTDQWNRVENSETQRPAQTCPNDLAKIRWRSDGGRLAFQQMGSAGAIGHPWIKP